MPWRVQFKAGSASTQAIPVFDASSGRRRGSDCSGGKCQTDLVCKGSNYSLDLLRVVLRFMIANTASAANLTKIYDQFG